MTATEQLDVDFTEVATGFAVAEGPLAPPDGSVVLVETLGGRITRIGPDGSRSVVAEPGGGPNRLAFGPHGRVYTCNNGGLT